MNKEDLMKIIESKKPDTQAFSEGLKSEAISRLDDSEWSELTNFALGYYQTNMSKKVHRQVIDILLTHLKEIEHRTYLTCLYTCIQRFAQLANTYAYIEIYKEARDWYQKQFNESRITLSHSEKLAMDLHLWSPHSIYRTESSFPYSPIEEYCKQFRKLINERTYQEQQLGEINRSCLTDIEKTNNKRILEMDNAGTDRTPLALSFIREIFERYINNSSVNSIKLTLKALKAMGVNLDCEALFIGRDGAAISAATYLVNRTGGCEVLEGLLSGSEPLIKFVSAEVEGKIKAWKDECARENERKGEEAKRLSEARALASQKQQELSEKTDYLKKIKESRLNLNKLAASELLVRLNAKYNDVVGLQGFRYLDSILSVIREKYKCSVDEVMLKFPLFEEIIKRRDQDFLELCANNNMYVLLIAKIRQSTPWTSEAIKLIPSETRGENIIPIINELCIQYGGTRFDVYKGLNDELKNKIKLLDVLEILYIANPYERKQGLLTEVQRSELQHVFNAGVLGGYDLCKLIRNKLSYNPNNQAMSYDQGMIFAKVGSYESFRDYGVDLSPDIAPSFFNRELKNYIGSSESLYDLTYYIHIKAFQDCESGLLNQLALSNVIGACVLASDRNCRGGANIMELSSPTESFIHWMITKWMPKVIWNARAMIECWQDKTEFSNMAIISSNSYLTFMQTLKKILSEKGKKKSMSGADYLTALQDIMIDKIESVEAVKKALRDELYLGNGCLMAFILQSVYNSDRLSLETDAYKKVRAIFSKSGLIISEKVSGELQRRIEAGNPSVRDVIFHLVNPANKIGDDEFDRIVATYLDKDSHPTSLDHEQVIDALLLLPTELAKAFKKKLAGRVLVNEDLRETIASLHDGGPDVANQNLIWHIINAGETTATVKDTRIGRDFISGLLRPKPVESTPIVSNTGIQGDPKSELSRPKKPVQSSSLLSPATFFDKKKERATEKAKDESLNDYYL